MTSEVKVYSRENDEIQRVQVVHLDDWSQLDFLWLKQETMEQQIAALGCFRDIYANYLVPAFPWIFPQMVMFALPEDDEMYDVLVDCARAGMQVGEHVYYKSKEYGNVTDPLTIATILLQDGVKLKNGKPVFANKEAERLYHELEKRGCVHIVCGKFPSTKIIPVGSFAGYMSQVEQTAKLKANAHFFIMDPFDCATVYDQVGTPFGLCIKDGVVENPPLCGREALLVEKDGVTYISKIDVRDLLIKVNEKTYIPGKNATIYTRPERAKTPDVKGTHLVIIGRRVVAVKHGGKVEIPASGFVLTVSKGCKVVPGDEVTYHGLKDVQFGIQVGNSIIRKGVKTEQFISKFYNIYHLERVPYPPCLFPMDFEKARAARMAIGADKDGKPVLFWAEGKGKLGYVAGEDSTGASLTEMAEIAEDLALRNAVNLDGGGSAQMLVDGVRALHISDRNKEDNSDAERLVPLGLIVR
ncbi:MAG: phosphodiester glycosidase family protein [Agathobacter sp.]|nr:phosphodiester glycosidase family protein [Agathobacter sp.]